MQEFQDLSARWAAAVHTKNASGSLPALLETTSNMNKVLRAALADVEGQVSKEDPLSSSGGTTWSCDKCGTMENPLRYTKHRAKWCISCGFLTPGGCTKVLRTSAYCGYWDGTKLVPPIVGRGFDRERRVQVNAGIQCAGGCRKSVVAKSRFYGILQFARKEGDGDIEFFCRGCAKGPIERALKQGMDTCPDLGPVCQSRDCGLYATTWNHHLMEWLCDVHGVPDRKKSPKHSTTASSPSSVEQAFSPVGSVESPPVEQARVSHLEESPSANVAPEEVIPELEPAAANFCIYEPDGDLFSLDWESEQIFTMFEDGLQNVLYSPSPSVEQPYQSPPVCVEQPNASPLPTERPLVVEEQVGESPSPSVEQPYQSPPVCVEMLNASPMPIKRPLVVEEQATECASPTKRQCLSTLDDSESISENEELWF